MSFTGLTCSENSTGLSEHRGEITRTATPTSGLPTVGPATRSALDYPIGLALDAHGVRMNEAPPWPLDDPLALVLIGPAWRELG
jgi:hypothetical protein